MEATKSTRLPSIKTNEREVITLGGSRKEWDEGLRPAKVVRSEAQACTTEPECKQPEPAATKRLDACIDVSNVLDGKRARKVKTRQEVEVQQEAKAAAKPKAAVKPEAIPAKPKEVPRVVAKASTRAEDPMGRSREPGKGKNFHVLNLMDICKLDTPLAKRVPNSQRATFFGNWGKLMQQAMRAEPERQYPAWCEWAMYHKAILWTPPRGGARLAKKARYADLVRDRMRRWTEDREKLWEETVHRSKTREVPTPVDPKDIKARNAKIEKAALAALGVGDVRKALQALNSAPIAPA